MGNKTDFAACVRKVSIYPCCLNIYSDSIEVRCYLRPICRTAKERVNFPSFIILIYVEEYRL